MNTKIYMVLSLIATLAVGMVAAVVDNPTSDSDRQCRTYGDFDFGIAKWKFVDGEYVLWEQRAGYDTLVNGTSSHAFWSSLPGADGLIVKEGQNRRVISGGESGEVFQESQYGIMYITMCGYDEPHEEIPEFGVIAALVVLVGVGLFVARRRD